jgi:hypothetical protein
MFGTTQVCIGTYYAPRHLNCLSVPILKLALLLLAPNVGLIPAELMMDVKGFQQIFVRVARGWMMRPSTGMSHGCH